MNLDSISCSELLKSCRYMNGENGTELLESFQKLDFNIFDNWQRVSYLWGYTELPEGMIKQIVETTADLSKLHSTLDILKRLHYPHLQCAAMVGFNDIRVFINLIREWNVDAEKDTSILWSILEIWFWKLENYSDIDTWLEKKASDYIAELYCTVFHAGHSKNFIRWLFSNVYIGKCCIQPSLAVRRKLLVLIDSVIVYHWKDACFDEDFLNLDYLSFVATDVDEYRPLSVKMNKAVLDSYDKIFQTKMLNAFSLPLNENNYNHLIGYAHSFIVYHKTELAIRIQEVINNYQSIFEGWKIKGQMHDLSNVQNEAFVLSAFLIMVKDMNADENEKTRLFRIIIDRLFLQIHNCPDLYLEYYSVPACFARDTAKHISECVLIDYDRRLISQHHNTECIAYIMNYSISIALHLSNKALIKERWDGEQPVWKRDFLSVGRIQDYKNLEAMINKLCS